MEIEHAHAFSVDEARARIRALTEYFANRYGLSVTWSDDDTAKLSGRYTVVSFEVTVCVGPTKVLCAGRDPGMLLRGPAKKYVSGKLEKYLSPAHALDTLPRG